MVLWPLGPGREIDYDGDDYIVHVRLPLLYMKPDLFNLIYFTGVIHVLCESYMKLDVSRQVFHPSSHRFVVNL
jgi:hypothetical protein